jgi:4-hydroxy-4-methyl-2-oxoglutarate aldolase
MARILLVTIFEVTATDHLSLPPMKALTSQINLEQMLNLKRFNTPTIYNGWERITRHDASREGMNLEETRDFMPQMGPMVGRAVTLVIQPSNPQPQRDNPDALSQYWRHVASVAGPKIVMVQDLDKPQTYGAFWGEVNSNFHRALGCVGTVIDGAIRDLDGMCNAGFKALARRLCVGHAFAHPIRWHCEVEVFGRKVVPNQLIHADQHGFMVVPPEDEAGLLEAAIYLDTHECNTVIAAGRSCHGLPLEEALRNIEVGCGAFRAAIETRFGRKEE